MSTTHFAGAVHGLRDSVRDRIAALGWLDFDAGTGATHANLPSDLFIVTLQAGGWIDARAPQDDALHVVITAASERRRQFRAIGRSRLVVATLSARAVLGLFGNRWPMRLDQPVPLEALCTPARVSVLRTALHRCTNLDEATAAFGRWLEAGLLEAGPLTSADARVARTALRISSPEQPCFDVRALAALEGITRRQLERDFRRALALSPGALARVVRFQRAAAAVSAGASLSHSALDNGYADQAHMNRAFKAYSGLTPRAMAEQGARPGRAQLRAGLAGRVLLLDLPVPAAAAQVIRLPRAALAPASPRVATLQDWHSVLMAQSAA